MLIDGLLVKADPTGTILQLLVPYELRGQLLDRMHNSVFGGRFHYTPMGILLRNGSRSLYP